MVRSDIPAVRILGIDPGSLITGYGIIESRHGAVRILTSGSIANRDGTAMCDRLNAIFSALDEIIQRYSPSEAAIETAFYGKNAQSALKLGHARGVSMLAAVRHGLPVHEYSPREVKKAITGNGSAGKDQVQFMVMNLLKMSVRPPVFDITDALAVAIAHMNRCSTAHEQSRKSWKAFITAHPGRVLSPKNGGRP
jgi:crossover junction endodeoxyribonuclease RuvC